MASSIAEITMPRSIDFSRATASAICSSSSLFALTAMVGLLYLRIAVASAQSLCREAVFLRIDRCRLSGLSRLWRAARRVRLEAEIAFQLALGLLAPSHRFRDQRI